MDSYEFYFKQPVSQVEFNGALNAAQDADWATIKDRRAYGILSGFVPTPSPMSGMTATPWNIACSAGVGYDKNGARVYSAGTITMSVLTDTTGTSNVPSAGNRRWISIYARFGRNNTDPRTDGDGVNLFFNQAEALNPDDVQAHVGQLLIVQGGQDLISNPLPARPALQTALLLADILITDGDSALVMGAIDTSRADRASRAFSWALPTTTEYTGSAVKYVLRDSSAGVGTTSRTYATSAGLVITTNAAWNALLQTWAADNPALTSSYVIFYSLGISLLVL